MWALAVACLAEALECALLGAPGGRDMKANAQLRCEPCHVQTPTYGDHHRLQ